MKSVVILSFLAVAVAGVAACASVDEAAGDESNISINKDKEDPARILGPDYETTVWKVIAPQDMGKTFGLPDDRVPYPDTYWPFLVVDERTNEKVSKNGIDDRWQGENTPSPLEKYMGLVDSGNAGKARDWEAKNHGELVPGVASWFGHCPGWTAAAMANPPVKHAVSVKRDGSKLVKCGSSSEQGCTSFEIGDINALEAEVFLSHNGGFIGARCDTKPSDVPLDDHGRVLKDGCRGLNPGALMIVLANRMKNINDDPKFVPQPIAINAQNDNNTDQIWNQPAYRYEVIDARSISEAEAIRSTMTGDDLPTKYPHNDAAKGFVGIEVSIHWVTEKGPNRQFVSGLTSTREMHFYAILELDGPPDSKDSKIIGGEYLDVPDRGERTGTRLTVPPFVWTADGGPDENGRQHNPYVKASFVQQLVKLAAE